MEDQAKAIPSDGEVIRRPNGDLYEGSILTIGGAWSRRIRDGHGRMKYSNGQVYEGQWKADTMSGHGLMTYSPFLSYLGDWRAGKKHGLGVLQARHGLQSLSWRGRWTDGLPSGYGEYRTRAGYRIYGTWSRPRYADEVKARAKMIEGSDTPGRRGVLNAVDVLLQPSIGTIRFKRVDLRFSWNGRRFKGKVDLARYYYYY